MGVTYAKGTAVELLDPAELGERLTAVVRQAMPWLQGITDGAAERTEAAGKWCAKEMMGHLTDSAINNHARIMRLQIEAGPKLRGYEQTRWVSLQHYAERPWERVLAVWVALNEHIAWAVGHISKADLAKRGAVEGDELTLGFLIEDYIAHMEHHLRALKAGIA